MEICRAWPIYYFARSQTTALIWNRNNIYISAINWIVLTKLSWIQNHWSRKQAECVCHTWLSVYVPTKVFFWNWDLQWFFPISKRNQSWWVLSSPARKCMRGVGPLGTRLKKVADAVNLRTSSTNLSVHVDTPNLPTRNTCRNLVLNFFSPWCKMKCLI